MVGRSNVGKSSLLNKLTGEASARVSSTPGRTRAIHFFDWPEGKSILVDLPGYGFAKRSQDEREEWGKLIQAYIQADRNLKRVLLLLDSRAGPTALDLDALQFLLDQKINVLLVFTKFDQLKNQSQRALRKREALGELSEFLGTKDFSPLWVSVRDPKSLSALKKEIVNG
jgi:GTP-binding protein